MKKNRPIILTFVGSDEDFSLFSGSEESLGIIKDRWDSLVKDGLFLRTPWGEVPIELNFLTDKIEITAPRTRPFV